MHAGYLALATPESLSGIQPCLRRRHMAQHLKFLCFCHNANSSSTQRLLPRHAQNSALKSPFVLRAFAPAPSASVVTPRDCAHPAPIGLHFVVGSPPPLSTLYLHFNIPHLASRQHSNSPRCIPRPTLPIFHDCHPRHTNSSPTRSRCHPYDRSHSTVAHSSRS